MQLEDIVKSLWEDKEKLDNVVEADRARTILLRVIDMLDSGEIRVAQIENDEVVVNEWVKQAILLFFKVQSMTKHNVGPFEFLDKIPLKENYSKFKVRVVPGASARRGSYLAPGVTLMPSYVNIGAYVDEDTMVDTWATVGSCAQIGKRVHLSGGVGIGGVLEPPQAAPVVIGDDVFIGSRSMIVEGARVKNGAKLGAGVILTSSTPVIDSSNGEEVSRGVVPERAVAIMATRDKEFPGGKFGLPCVLILRYLEEGEQHDKLLLNNILREHGVAT
ncbi:MAG: 2,3,4,5-tetrahydropyridine-2,6-dicarboxylate N-succinyltransferase [Acidimicrobiia bacterium]